MLKLSLATANYLFPFTKTIEFIGFLCAITFLQFNSLKFILVYSKGNCY